MKRAVLFLGLIFMTAFGFSQNIGQEGQNFVVDGIPFPVRDITWEPINNSRVRFVKTTTGSFHGKKRANGYTISELRLQSTDPLFGTYGATFADYEEFYEYAIQTLGKSRAATAGSVADGSITEAKLATEVVEKLNSDGGVSVSDYAALKAVSNPSNGDLATVTDDNIFGVFKYNSSLSASDDNGIIINGWVRQFSGAVHTDWYGQDGVALQAAIDYVESNPTKEIILDRNIQTLQDINISGNEEITITGNGPTEIFTGFPGYTINVGNMNTVTTAQVNLTDLIIRDGGNYADKLKIMNHIRFTATRCKISEGLNGVVVTSRGDGGASYMIRFDQCEIVGNSNYGLHIVAENGGGYNYTNDVQISGGYIADNLVNTVIEIEPGAGDSTAHKFNGVYFDNGDPTKRNLEIIGSHGNYFTGCTFDGRQDGLNEITLDANTYDNYFSGNRIIDGIISDLGSQNKFDNGLPSIIFFTGNRDISHKDINNTLSVESDGILTITPDFDRMLRHQYIFIETRGNILTVQGAVGVNINGTSAGSKVVGDGSGFIRAVLRKVNTNSYAIFSGGGGNSSGGGVSTTGTPGVNEFARFSSSTGITSDPTITYDKSNGDNNLVIRQQATDSYIRMGEFDTSWLGGYIRYDNVGNKIDYGGHPVNNEDKADDVIAFSVSRSGDFILTSDNGTAYIITISNTGVIEVNPQ